MKRTFTFALLMLASLLFAQALSRVKGTVKDSEGKPIEGVKVIVTDPKVKDYNKEMITNKKGQFVVAVTDGTHTYKFHFEHPDYITYEEMVKPIIFQTLEKDFVLKTEKELAELEKQKKFQEHPELQAMEDGFNALQNNNLEEAKKYFKKALEIKPDHYKAYLGLADIALKQKNYEEAEKYALKVLEYDKEIAGVYRILLACAQKKKDEKKIREYQAKLAELEPEDPMILFNQAADLINQGKDQEALPLLEKVVELKPDFYDAYYELGFCYLRTGKMEEAKKTLQKYVEMVPEGEKTNTAKEALKYL